MSPDRERADAMLREVVLGERRDDDREWLAAVAAFPELRQRAAALRAVQRELDAMPDDAAAVARAAAAQVSPADRAAVAGALDPRRRRTIWPLLLAALVALALLVQFWPRANPASGPLGPGSPATVELVDGHYRVRRLEPLAGGARYRLILTIDGARFAEQTFEGHEIELPEPWHTALRTASSATLLILAGDVALPTVRIK